MKRYFCLLLAVPTLFAASLPKTNPATTTIHGDYIEARTADVFTGPCFANSEVDLVGNLAVFGWRVNQGSWKGVKLDGLGVVGVVKASNTLGNVSGSAYPVKAMLIVDEKANAEQRLALKAFAQRMGGDLLQDVVKIEYQPIAFEFTDNNIHSGSAKLTAGTLAEIRTRAISNKDHLCSNEENWYNPLTKLAHAMPAYALSHSFRGQGLGTTWSSPEKRSAFLGSFELND
ncbi:MAG TPA: DUF1326 domain-containing protein [Bryobacteraceae bacterium]|nr:DUF1326 domain-containing protein [Bryobacteraceae bacterium]